jgi:hypothetical protein
MFQNRRYEPTATLPRLDSAEFETIRDHVDDGDIVDMKPVNERASSEIH